MVFICLSLLFGTTAVAGAAISVPVQDVYSAGTPFTYGEAENGRVYVPVRGIFELYDAAVNWLPETKTVEIRRCDGAVLTMRPGSKTAIITCCGQSENLVLDAPVKLSDGKTMLPLRFVVENLLCKVDWLVQDKKVVITKCYATTAIADKKYTIDFQTEDFYTYNSGGGWQFAGKLSGVKSWLESEKWDQASIKNVELLSGNNYLVELSLGLLDSHSRPTIYAYLNSHSQTCTVALVEPSEFDAVDYNHCLVDGRLWLPETERILVLDNATGEQLTKYDYRAVLTQVLDANSGLSLAEINKIGFSYCDGEHMLLSYNKKNAFNTKYFALIDLKTNEFRDLIPELIPADELQYFIRGDYVSPYNSLQFVTADEQGLYFEYIQYDELYKPSSQTIFCPYEKAS